VDPILISIAFVLGFAVRQVGLPPLVGYLVAGFVLKAMGFVGGEILEDVADMGVILLLFSIGLKLKLRSLARPEVWAGASIHMMITIIVFGLAIYCLAMVGLSGFAGLDIKRAGLIAFALSFSSTVFAVKVLEERAEMAALHGRVAIGVLIVQDILAVVFLTASTGKLPSVWALTIPFILVLIRPLLMRFMDRSGHGELLILYGLFLALVAGAAGFELVGLKPDLGALIIGMLVAGHPKASELSNSLFSFKEIFLIGFFLSIGLSGVPSLETLGIAALLVLVVPFKVVLFFLLFSRFKLRARTSFLASLSLANYSEFGLIVAYIGVSQGWIATDWLIVIAIALSITFVLASPLNSTAYVLYDRLAMRLRPLETKTRHPDDQPIEPGDAKIAVFGMGRVGAAAYDDMVKRHGAVVIGIDHDFEVVNNHQAAGRNVILGDPTDFDFWERTTTADELNIKIVLLAMPKHAANLAAVKEIRARKFSGVIATTAQFDDEIESLNAAGADAVYYFFDEAGFGLAEHVCKLVAARPELGLKAAPEE
jgi:predicted Kef-type K+ transport protein